MGQRLRLFFILPTFGSVYIRVEAFVTELVSRLDASRYAITVLSGSHARNIPGIHFEKGRLLARERLAWLNRMPRLRRLLRPPGVRRRVGYRGAVPGAGPSQSLATRRL